MKKFDFKSIVVGLLIGIIGVSAIFASREKKPTIISNTKVATTPESKGIKSAAINNGKVYFNGNEIKLKNPLVTIVKDENSESQLYMPVSELLEYMNFKVECNSKDNSVYLTMNGQNNLKSTSTANETNAETKERIQKGMEITVDSSNNATDAEAIETIKKTGNWSYIEKYIPNMTNNGIEKVVEIYNSKHTNPSEYKKASDYIKK